MNKTAYFNHNLMKRRYSVPETIMRKHKLQELLSKKTTAAVESKPPTAVKDESCQTEEIFDPRRKKTSKRKRDGLRYFKKSNTYCQYKSYLHKKKYHREIKSGTSATEESTYTSSPLGYNSISSTSLPILVDPKKCLEGSKSVSRQTSAPSSNEEFEKLVITETKKSTSLHPYRQPSRRQLSVPEKEDFWKQDHQNKLHPIRQSSAPSSSDEKHTTNLKVADKLLDSSKRIHTKNCQSFDQNTSGYNTICGSLDEYTTPRKKTPDNVKISTTEEPHQENCKSKMYPITFHSESVFLHPCQQGIISHKQFHQISIQMTPEDVPQKQKTEPEPKNDYFKTEIKLNVNDSKDQEAKAQPLSADPPVKHKLSSVTTPRPEATFKLVPTRCTTPTVQITEVPSSPRPNQVPEDNTYDCSVPSTTNYPIEGGDKSNLKIEVDVGNVGIPTNLHDILLGQKKTKKLETVAVKPKEENKFNSKAAWNYLFQKLGHSYPRRHLLKQPVFEYKPQFSKYYSELPKPERKEIPPKVLFNNQTYNILSGNLLPNEWSTVNPTVESEHLSDSDISIPDSLEDFQHQTTKYHNKYNKYDEKLARGDIPAKPPVQPSKNKGIAYFIPLLDSNKTKPIMPAELRKKLCQRNQTLPKHSICSEPTFATKKSPRNKFIHKQIQTCLNSDDSLKKRRKKFADANQQKNSESQTELDEKIKNILLSGIEDSPAIQDQQRMVQQTFNQSVQTESVGEPVVSEYVEMFNVSLPVNNSKEEFFKNDRLYEIILSEEEVGRINSNNFYRSIKKCRRIYYPNKMAEQRPVEEARSSYHNSNMLNFSTNPKKLTEFKKQNTLEKISPPQNHSKVHDASSELLPLPYSRMKKSREKSKVISKIPGPKRYYQKFEAIPEELSNSSDSGVPFNLQLSGNSDENNESMPAIDSDEDFCQVDENKNLIKEESAKFEAQQPINNFQKIGNGVNDEKDHQENDTTSENCRIELKSQKGRDSLLISNEHEELVTLSKGWINFYLLKGVSTEENSAPEDVDDENVAHSETIQIPQQYSIHVHATPELVEPPNGINSSLPGLCKTTKKFYKCEKLNQIHTSLPDIPSVSSNQGKNSIICDSRDSQFQTMLPKLHYSGDESDTSTLQKYEFIGTQSNEPVGIQREAAKQENSISNVATSSNHSESPCEELPGRHIKKFQKYQRPHTYHSTRTTRNQWSLTLKGSNDDKHVNDIEMQLSLKNNPNQYIPTNQSWKLTFKSENTETSQLTKSSRQIHQGYLPHLNVNYKMLPSPNYHEESMTANYSEHNSGSNSALSCGSRKYKLDSELLLQNVTSLNNDLTLQIRHSDDDLTVRGSTITPERKPRVPTMSERDLMRMRLIKQTSTDTK